MIEPALSTSTPPPEEDVTTTLYRAAIGPVSSGYYLPIFTRFEVADHAGISWNTAASLLTLNWLIFRKLWVAALAYVGIVVAVALLVFGIGHLVFQFSDTLLMALGLGFGLAAFVLPGLFGNALFHTEARKAMAKALTGHSNVADARDALLRQASSRKRLIVLAAVNVVFLLVVGLSYQQFSALSHVAVMPHGALEAGNVAVGRTTDTTSPVRMLPASAASASAAAEPVPAASAPGNSPPTPASSSASTPVADLAPSLPVSAPVSAPVSPASAPGITPVASQPQVTTSTPARTTAIAATPPASAPVPTASASTASAKAAAAPAKAASASASKAKAKPQAASPKASAPVSAPAVQVRTTKEPEKAKAGKKPQAAVAGEPAQKASATASSTAVAKSFFINVGLFGMPENAAKAHAKLLEAGLPSVMKELKAKTRQIRVRVGPYASQAQADAAAEKIKALELEASIIQL